MLAYPTNGKQARDSLGRYITKNKAPAIIAANSPPELKYTPTPTSLTRTSSRLSESYELVTQSQASTPFSRSPIIPTLHLLQTTANTEDMVAEVITPFQGDKEDESPEDFLRVFFRQMGNNSDETKKAQFWYYLQANSAADEWYSDLVEDEKKTWADIKTAFYKRWPRKKQARKTDDEYEDEILGRKLKVEDLVKKEKVGGREVYSHLTWADKIALAVKGAKLNKTTTHIRQVRKDLPTILREKIGTKRFAMLTLSTFVIA